MSKATDGQRCYICEVILCDLHLIQHIHSLAALLESEKRLCNAVKNAAIERVASYLSVRSE